MKAIVEVKEKEFYDNVKKAVNEFLYNEGLLRLMREQIIAVLNSTSRRDLKEQVRILSERVSQLEIRLDKRIKRLNRKCQHTQEDFKC
jgi:GH24 family phage-related lysozyme (muramidase)